MSDGFILKRITKSGPSIFRNGAIFLVLLGTASISFSQVNKKNESRGPAGTEQETSDQTHVESHEVESFKAKPQVSPFWKKRFESLMQEDYKHTQVVFLGDSITEGWNNQGKQAWDTHFFKFHPANFGFSSDKVENVLWRVENGNLAAVSPKAVVLLIGTNNLQAVKDNSELVKGIFKLVALIKKTLPNSKIVLLGLLPREGSAATERIREINVLINKEVEETNELGQGAMSFVDMGNELFSSEHEELRCELYQADKLHLNSDGYKVLAKKLKPIITNILNGEH